MERTDSPAWIRNAGRGLTAATTILTAIAGWYGVWTSPVNGDEGYLIVSLREWVLRGGLYDRVYSQYGPFYYSVFGVPSRLLGSLWTIPAGRVTTLVLWVATAFLFGVVVRVITQRWMFGIVAQVLSFFLLATLLNEPMHPGALLCALLGALLANVAWLRPRAPRASDLISGALAAAMFLTKVNVGLFAIIALVFVLGEGARRREVRWAACGALVAFGPALLLATGHAPWRLLWAAVYVCGAFAVVVASRMHVEEPRNSLDWQRLLAGFVIVTVTSVGLMLVTGSSAGELFRNVLIRPRDHERVDLVPIHFSGMAWAWLLLLPIGAVLLRRRPPFAPSRPLIAWSGVVRVAAGLALMTSVLGRTAVVPFHPQGSRFALLPLAALAVLPRFASVDLPATLVSRRLLAACALTESLHAFPVPGSQVSWSVLTAGIAAVVVIADGIEELSANMRLADARVIASAAVMSCLAIVFVVPYGINAGGAVIRSPGEQFRNWFDAYQHQLPVANVDTGRLRPPRDQREAIDKMVPLIRAGCGAVEVLGAGLFWYVVADRRPPSGFNQPAWYDYLDRREQTATIAALLRSTRVCVILGFPAGLTLGGRIVLITPVPGDEPLLRYLEGQRWEVLGQSGGSKLVRAVSQT